tara:strand:+ start:2731 stop:3417 length:687 start_codon:yes stop_codon:yes gene_type:complete
MGIGSKFGVIAETGNNIQTEGLVFYVDSSIKKSYPRTGATTFNLASGSLTPTGSLINDTGWVGINPSSSFTFDGTDDQIIIPYNPILDVASSSHSLSFWMKTSSGGTKVIMEKGRGDELAAFIISNKIYWGGNWSYYGGTTVVNNGNWYSITFVADGTSSTIYIDGSSVATKTVALPSTNTEPFTIGTDANGANDYTGDISNIKIYNRALSASDVLQNYNAQKDRFGL